MGPLWLTEQLTLHARTAFLAALTHARHTAQILRDRGPPMNGGVRLCAPAPYGTNPPRWRSPYERGRLPLDHVLQNSTSGGPSITERPVAGRKQLTLRAQTPLQLRSHLIATRHKSPEMEVSLYGGVHVRARCCKTFIRRSLITEQPAARLADCGSSHIRSETSDPTRVIRGGRFLGRR